MSYLQKHAFFLFFVEFMWIILLACLIQNSSCLLDVFFRVCALLQWTLQYYFLQYAVNFSLSLFR